MDDARRFSDAFTRNREPILAALAPHVRPGDRVVELGAGSGQHATFLAARLPVASWLPTDPDPGARASIDAWRAWDRVPSVLPAAAFDAADGPWDALSAEVVVAINLVHIAPWEATVALFAALAERPPRVLYLYGPYRRAEVPTAPSNEAFDRWLRDRDARSGLRDLAEVIALATRAGLPLRAVVDMPANNLSVVFGPAVPPG